MTIEDYKLLLEINFEFVQILLVQQLVYNYIYYYFTYYFTYFLLLYLFMTIEDYSTSIFTTIVQHRIQYNYIYRNSNKTK